MGIDYFEPAEVEIDPVVYKLSGADISKSDLVYQLDVCYCYDWYYMIKVKELNEMKLTIAEWEKIKQNRNVPLD